MMKHMENISKKIRPNFFLAFKVDDTEIHKRVKKLQEELLARNSMLHPAIVNVSTLHVTLAVTYIKNDLEIQTVKNALDNWASQNLKVFFNEPLVLNFLGTNTFKNNVAYVDIEKDYSYKRLCSIAENLKQLLVSAGFVIDHRPITPHLTFLKLNRDEKLRKMKKYFLEDFAFLKAITDNFGMQNVTSIQLLSMDEPKCENGYYKCLHQIQVADVYECTDHSECCSPIPKPD